MRSFPRREWERWEELILGRLFQGKQKHEKQDLERVESKHQRKVSYLKAYTMQTHSNKRYGHCGNVECSVNLH